MTTWPPYHRPETYPVNTTGADVPSAVVTPHSQAWGIPETFVIDDLPLDMTTKQLQALVGTVWSEYIAQDEILAAVTFLENAPYRVRHTDLTEQMLRWSKQMIAWIEDEKTFDRYNSPRNSAANTEPRTDEMLPVSEATVRLVNSAAADRFNWMRDRFPAGSTVADFGCIDGMMSNRWGLYGFKVTGFDISTTSVAIANAAAEREKTGVVHIRTFFKDVLQHVPPASFDNATAGDVYEHLLDPVNDLLIPVRSVLRPSGQFLMSVPHGAWHRGNFKGHHHSWTLGELPGEAWNSPVRKRAHVVAPSVWSVTANLRKAGFYVYDCAVKPSSFPDLPGQGNIFARAIFRLMDGSLPDVVVCVDAAKSPWNPHSVDVGGHPNPLVVEVMWKAQSLAEAGHRVRVYTQCGEWGEGVYRGVEYRHIEKFHDLKCDVLISDEPVPPERSVQYKTKHPLKPTPPPAPVAVPLW